MISPSQSSHEAGAYISCLQISIKEYCTGFENDNTEVWLYNGFNLRPAVEKKLYFKLIDQRELRKTFASTGQIDIQNYLSDKTTNNSAVRHNLRKLRSAFDRSQIVNRLGKTIALVSSQKHKSYCLEAVLVDELEVLLFDDLILAYEKKSIPNKAASSNVLFKYHYDLLVYFEILQAFINDCHSSTVVFIEGNTPQDYIGSIISKSLNKRSVCLQFGWAFNVHLGFQNLVFDSFLSWGRPFSQLLSIHSSDTEFIDVGHPTLRISDKDRNDNCISFICQAPFRWIGLDTFNSFIDSIELTAKQGWQILVRAHPSWPLDAKVIDQLQAFDNVKIVDNSTLRLQDQLAESSLAVTVFSSVGFESMITGTIPVFTLFDMTIDLQPKFNIGMNQMIFHSMDAFLKQLSELRSRPDLVSNLRNEMIDLSQQMFSATGDEAKKLIASHLND